MSASTIAIPGAAAGSRAETASPGTRENPLRVPPHRDRLPGTLIARPGNCQGEDGSVTIAEALLFTDGMEPICIACTTTSRSERISDHALWNIRFTGQSMPLGSGGARTRIRARANRIRRRLPLARLSEDQSERAHTFSGRPRNHPVGVRGDQPLPG